MDIAKKTAHKVRELLMPRATAAQFETLRRQLDAIHHAQLQINHEQQGLLNYLQQLQLEINHNQLAILNRVDERTKNSGTVYLSETEIATKLFSGLKLYVDPRDMTLAVHLALDGIWESDITGAWLQVVKSGDVVVDIGANYGYFGALAAQKIYGSERARFLFFEANPYLIPYIRRTLAANSLIDKSTVENFAIAAKAGEVELGVSPYYLGNASLNPAENRRTYGAYQIHDEELEIKKVRAISLDAYCDKHGIKKVNVIKIDIEGHEQQAYAGMRGIVKASPDVSLFIEFTQSCYDNPKRFYEQLLSDFGHVYKIEADGRIVKPKNQDYATVIDKTDSWVMPIFSKNPGLASK